MRGGKRLVAFGFRSLYGVDGGIETHARELYPRLAEDGFSVVVLARSPYRRKPPRHVLHVDQNDLVEKTLYAPKTGGLEAMVHSSLAALYCICTRPDVVHVHGIGPALFVPLLRLSGLRVVMTHHGQDYLATKWGAFARSLLRAGERAGVRTANAVICVSNYLRDTVRDTHSVVGHTIYNGVPRHHVMSRPHSSILANLETGTYVLMVGRLTPHKRVEDVIRAMQTAETAGLRLVVCGAGLETGYARRLRTIAGNGAEVLFTGSVPPDDLAWVYRNALCTVMASSYEGMPLAVLEALAHGSRIFLSRIPAHEELCLPADRYFEVGDVAAIRQCIVRTRGDQRTHDETNVGLVNDARFSWPVIAAQTKAVLLGLPVPSATSPAVGET